MCDSTTGMNKVPVMHRMYIREGRPSILIALLPYMHLQASVLATTKIPQN